MISEVFLKKIESTFKKKQARDFNIEEIEKQNKILEVEEKNRIKEEEEEKENELKDIANEFTKRFNREMFEHRLYNSFNKTYKLTALTKTPYGFTAQIELVSGLNFIKLKEHLTGLQQSLDSILILDYRNNKKVGTLKVILKDINVYTPFEPQHIRPNQMYLGMSFLNEPLIIDCNKYCMFIVAGATGSGKTRYLYTILLSWISHCSPSEIGIFLSDLAKSEFSGFRYVKHVEEYAEELKDLWLIAQFLSMEMDRRKKILAKYRDRKNDAATNIEEYNMIEPNKKMKYYFCLIDEFSAIMPDATDSEDEKIMKEKILAVLKKIAKQGRSLGIFCILATQKTTKEEMPAILKNMSAVRISFRANDSISSEVILGDDCAVGLDDRIAFYSLNGGADKDYLFSPNLETNYMNAIIARHSNRSYQKESLDIRIKALEARENQKSFVETEYKKKEEKKQKSVLPENSNLFRKPVVNYEIQDYSNMKVITEEEAKNKLKNVDKVEKNGWYALENKKKAI